MLRQAFVRRSLSLGNQLLSIQKRGYNCPPAPIPKCRPCCEIPRPPKPPCCTPLQPRWIGPCDKICLPCCDKICVPFNCKLSRVGEPKCKKEEYRLPSYSECTKFQRGPAYKKECCYYPFLCHVDSIAAKEIHSLVPIKERQRRVLLSRIKSS